MIMPLLTKRLRLNIPTDGKVLKSCIRCRLHKTKCDAIKTNPLACTHCSKKNINCTLDVITKPPERNNDLIEKLSMDVISLKQSLDSLIFRKNEMVKLLIERSTSIQNISTRPLIKRSYKSITPPISLIQSCVSTPQSTPPSPPLAVDYEFTFSTSANSSSPGFKISVEESYALFTNYESNFNLFLPIFPEEFFSTINLVLFENENPLLFWCIILTSYLNYPDEKSSKSYKILSQHVKSLVVQNCWFETPRSIYLISALLVLTTWPLPNNHSKVADNISIKYLSMMKNLLYQFGLHKLEFINEFSHKTKISFTQEVNLDNLIRERIYKFTNINSNYWLINLGLANDNNNNQDYILNKSSNIDIFNKSIDTNDYYINSLLKISQVQSKLNDNMNDLINNNSNNESILLLPNQINTSKLINLNMFETILDDLKKVLIDDENIDKSINDHNIFIKISIEYSKLQLFIYSLSHINVSIDDYRGFVFKIVNCCFKILDLFQIKFKDLSSINQLPIHYKFPIELSTLVLLRVFKSPLLNSVNEYRIVKDKFNQFYKNILLCDSKNGDWNSFNARFLNIINKFNNIDNSFIMKQMNYENGESETCNSFFLINRMKSYLVSSLSYELIWLIYSNEKLNSNDKIIDWKVFGIDKDVDSHLVEYLVSNESIFD
jgi:hypothetical protein